VKKLILVVAIIATALTQESFGQPTTIKHGPGQLLTYYYHVKNALVAGDATAASANASAFTKIANSIDQKMISKSNTHTLARGAARIAETNDITKQREFFADFSAAMAAVAKAVKLTDQPIYQQYCPMKKTSWLSSEKEIRNPYYGSSMLTCGQVTSTLYQ